MELKGRVFNEALNEAVVHEALRWYQASGRQGTHSALTRTEVSGGGVKPWKQKGTGRARAGSIRSPLWRKGGVIFPPKPRDYSYALPKKIRKLALRVALSEFNRQGKIKVVPELKLSAPKTKEGVKFLKEIGAAGKILFLTAGGDANFIRGTRNIAGVVIRPALVLNIYDLLRSQSVVVEKAALAILEERLA